MDLRSFWEHAVCAARASGFVALGFLLFLLSAVLPCIRAEAAVRVDAVFPYSLVSGEMAAPAGSSQLFYVSIEHSNAPEENARIEIRFPDGFSASAGERWRKEADGRLVSDWTLPADYGQVFDAFSVKVPDGDAGERREILLSVTGDGWREEKNISFAVSAAAAVPEKKKRAAKRTDWYIQGISVPVDSDGKRDERRERNTLYVRDVSLENLRNRITGSGGVDWNAVYNEPAAYVLVELRNPKHDVRSLRFRAELADRETGEAVKGLVTVGAADGSSGWTAENEGGTNAVIGLDGNTVQNVVIPLYGDPREMEEGEYSLRTTVWDDSTSKTTDTPIHVVKKRNLGIFAVSFALGCAALILLFAGKLRGTILSVGAGGDIAVALFASLAFGGVAVPVTLFGDFLHVFLGPFAGLVTGLLSGVLQYMLLMSLLCLFRKPGVAALFFLMKWLLAGLLFGRFTPVAVLNYAVYIGVIEAALWLGGFYTKKEISTRYALFISLLMGMADMAVTLLNLQQLMFFYRLYYADWFIGLYMVANGLLYSSAGSWLGLRIGNRLRQVMGQ